MKYLLLIISFLISSCANQNAVRDEDQHVSQSQEYSWESFFDYSSLGRRSLEVDPILYSAANLNSAESVCKILRDADVKLVRVKRVILSSRAIHGIESQWVNTEKFQALLGQYRYGDESQKKFATGMMMQVEKVVKDEVSASLEDAFRHIANRADEFNANYILMGDFFDSAQPSCPDLFSIEKEMVKYIDREQKL